MNYIQLKSIVKAIVEKQAQDPIYEPVRYASSRGNIVTLQRDDFHFFVKSPRISLQIAVYVHQKGVMTAIFASPQVVTGSTRPAFVEFVNTLNLQERTLGCFSVDEFDLCYQSFIPAYFIVRFPEQARCTMFCDGVRIFESVATPIYGLAKEGWSGEKAGRFVEQLYHDGYIYDDYFE